MSTHSHDHESKTRAVVILTAVTMVVEIVYGLTSNSMALLADGIHMGSHVLAIGLSWVAYIFVRKLEARQTSTVDTSKILSLSGYSSGLMLLMFAIVILVEAVQRLFTHALIQYDEAIAVAVIGLAINIVSAVILHHDHEHTDHNIKSAYLHVLADALTSVTAIVGLIAAKYWDLPWVDAAGAILSSLVIVRWSVGLLKDSGKNLLGM